MMKIIKIWKRRIPPEHFISRLLSYLTGNRNWISVSLSGCTGRIDDCECIWICDLCLYAHFTESTFAYYNAREYYTNSLTQHTHRTFFANSCPSPLSLVRMRWRPKERRICIQHSPKGFYGEKKNLFQVCVLYSFFFFSFAVHRHK